MSRSAKIGYILFYFIINISSYFLIKLVVTNDYNLFLPIDGELPFLPQFIWIYHTLLPMMIGTMIMRHHTKRDFLTNFWAMAAGTVIISAFYVLLPSFYPYPEFVPSTWAEHLTYLTHQVDGASNTFPSGHTAFSWLLYLGVKNSSENTKGKWIYFVWSLLIMVSTLVLKQHYIVDVFAGFALAYACYYGAKYFTEKYYARASNRPEPIEIQVSTLREKNRRGEFSPSLEDAGEPPLL